MNETKKFKSLPPQPGVGASLSPVTALFVVVPCYIFMLIQSS
jgi:hypothetical protein